MALTVLILQVKTAQAEIVVADSVEWVVASSDVILRGKVIEVVRSEGLFIDEVWDKVTIEVAETLRGPKQDKLNFVMRWPKPINSPGPTGLQKSAKELLLFLVRSEEHKKHGPAGLADTVLTLRRDVGIIDLSVKECEPLPTMDFKLLQRSEDLLKLVREAAQEAPKPKSIVLGIPHETEAFRKLWRGSGVVIVVPVNSRLEARAREWYQSKDLVYRVTGIDALGQFQSDDNIRLMKSLLDNAETCEGVSDGKSFRWYPLRIAAYEALQQWGIQVKKPVTKEPVE